MSIKISVLVPTLGAREHELERLFKSLIEQAYDNLELIIVAQDNFDKIKKLCNLYVTKLNIVIITSDIKGLSRARNLGLSHVSGDIILLSDDDCWYAKKALQKIAAFFDSHPNTNILLTQIYDPIAGTPYKNYSLKEKGITKSLDLLSRSSIEIAFRRTDPMPKFDERFGLGGKYVAGEENDYLIRSLRDNKIIQYEPFITVYHEKKHNAESNKQLIAKGAFYAKNFGFFISNAVLIRDLLLKHQNNYRWFWNGYFDFKKND